MNDSIKMAHLLDWSKDKKISRHDLSYLLSNLSLENRKKFQLAYGLKEKVRNEKPIKFKAKKRYVVAVFDGAEFCAELSVAYGRIESKSRIAILDTDRLNPRLDLYYNTESHVKNMYHHLSREQSTGINLLIDGLHRNQLSPAYADHLAIKLKGLKNVFYFSGSSLIEDYEYFDLSDFKKIVAFLKAHYDILLLNTNGFIYDAYTCYALMCSDLNVLPVRGQWPQVKSLIKTIDFLCMKQNINKEKQRYVLFDHQKYNHLSTKNFGALVGNKTLNPVPFLKSRHMSQERVYSPLKKNNFKLQNIYYKVIQDIDRGVGKNEFSQKSPY